MSKGGGLFLVLRPFYGEKSALDEANGGDPDDFTREVQDGVVFS